MDFIPVENSDYHSIDYWNQRFAQEENYEWCGGYSNFQTLFNQYVPRTDSILIVGKSISYMLVIYTGTIDVCFLDVDEVWKHIFWALFVVVS